MYYILMRRIIGCSKLLCPYTRRVPARIWFNAVMLRSCACHCADFIPLHEGSPQSTVTYAQPRFPISSVRDVNRDETFPYPRLPSSFFFPPYYKTQSHLCNHSGWITLLLALPIQSLHLITSMATPLMHSPDRENLAPGKPTMRTTSEGSQRRPLGELTPNAKLVSPRKGLQAPKGTVWSPLKRKGIEVLDDERGLTYLKRRRLSATPTLGAAQLEPQRKERYGSEGRVEMETARFRPLPAQQARARDAAVSDITHATQIHADNDIAHRPRTILHRTRARLRQRLRPRLPSNPRLLLLPHKLRPLLPTSRPAPPPPLALPKTPHRHPP